MTNWCELQSSLQNRSKIESVKCGGGKKKIAMQRVVEDKHR